MAEKEKTGDVNTVWIACRAKAGCTGNQAVKVAVSGSNSGLAGIFTDGTNIRYRCTTCNGVFHIRH